MLRYAIIFFVIALIAAVLGFSGIAGAATNIAWVLFVVFVILAIIFAAARQARLTRHRLSPPGRQDAVEPAPSLHEAGERAGGACRLCR